MCRSNTSRCQDTLHAHPHKLDIPMCWVFYGAVPLCGHFLRKLLKCGADFLTFCEITELREIARLMPSLEHLQRMSPAVKFLCEGCCYLSISNITQEMTPGHVCGGLSPRPVSDRVSLCTPSCLGRLSIDVWKPILIVSSFRGQGILGCMEQKR